MADGVNGEHAPSALEAPGVTRERLAAFADAAKRFFEAAPWQHLGEHDPIEVEAPQAGAGLSLLTVMGGAGHTFGLGFFSSMRRYRAMMDGTPPETLMKDGSDWAVYLSPPWETAFGDLYAWERYGLPLASDRAYPTAVRFDAHHRPQRPDAGRLAYFEGLLRVLADTSESEMDDGRWSRTVMTAEGEQTYVLTLPDLLTPAGERAPAPDRRAMERFTAAVSRAFKDEQFDSIEDLNAAMAERFAGVSLDDLPSTASTPLEVAQDVMYEAFEARGRRQVQLIRRALALSPDCADAYALLAERAASPATARPFYEQAVAAGERALGPEAFSDPDRSWWGDIETRPYMRARAGLAECLLAIGDTNAAAAHFRALLQLNPGDNQGLRYRLLTTLLRAGRNAEAESLLAEYADEQSPTFKYAAVLLALRRQDQPAARRLLRAAMKANRRVPAYLAGLRDLPPELPSHYAIGSDDEAVLCADDLMEPWSDTPGAAAWLRKELAKTSRR
jgi:tetratricopeptide (TPR) repeat protein